MAHPWAVGILEEQAGVATRTQLLAEGLSWGFVRSQVEARRWRELNEHVIVDHNGPLTHEQKMWAVFLSAPQPAAMCGLTAMAQWGISGFETNKIHILVRRGGRVLPVLEVEAVVHESRRFDASHVFRGRAPSATSLPRSTVDAASWSRDVWTAYRIFVSPVQQGGAEALSEVEFLRFCRRHRLPRPVCQRRMDNARRWRYLDATFELSDGRVVRVEIDGGVHLSLAVRSRDTLKDNNAVLDRRLVLRYVSADIYADSPEVVTQLRRACGVGSAC